MLPVTRRALVALGAAVLYTGCDLGTTVEVVEVASIEIPHAVEPVRAGNSIRVRATPVSSRGEELTRDLSWSSNNTSVASVSATGRVTTTSSAGAATITASADGASSSVVVYSVPLACEVEGTLRPGDAVSNASLATGCVVGERVVQPWFLQVSNAVSVQIEMTSASFDTYLYLYRWTEEEGLVFIAEDNNGAGGTNARLSASLSTGIYFIAAGSLDNRLGGYQLSVSQ